MPYKDPEKRREAARASAKRYAERHPEKIKERNREYRSRADNWFTRNPERYAAKKLEWERLDRERNPERWRKKGMSEQARRARKKWWDKNREPMSEQQRIRRQDPLVKAQRAEYARLDKLRNPDKYRDKSYRRKYGITLEDYNRMLAEQGGKCAICHEPCRGTSERPHLRLHVDHSHETGAVRGLLCHRCNVAVGYLEHMERGLRLRAEAYLRDCGT